MEEAAKTEQESKSSEADTKTESKEGRQDKAEKHGQEIMRAGAVSTEAVAMASGPDTYTPVDIRL